MNPWGEDLVAWWASGGAFMPLMLSVSLVLYTLIGERWWWLRGAAVAWAKTASPLRAQVELAGGFAVIRALTVALPLLGLLGTVSGMVRTFASLAHGPTGAAAQGAGAGIAVALSATQYGIFLATPALVAAWFLRRRVDAILHSQSVLGWDESEDLLRAAQE